MLRITDNLQLLEQTRDSLLAIQAGESQYGFDMDYWFKTPNMVFNNDEESDSLYGNHEPVCGTTMCIGGWIVYHHLTNRGLPVAFVGTGYVKAGEIHELVEKLSADLLGLDWYNNADELHFMTDWPSAYRDMAYEVGTLQASINYLTDLIAYNKE
jgi:hypothetical protein